MGWSATTFVPTGVPQVAAEAVAAQLIATAITAASASPRTSPPPTGFPSPRPRSYSSRPFSGGRSGARGAAPLRGYPVRPGGRGHVGQHPVLAAAQDLGRQPERCEERRHPEGDLDRDDALLAPVDVLELEQQGRLVDGQPGAEPERDGKPLVDALVLGQDRDAARDERQRDAGHEVVHMPPTGAHAAERAKFPAPADDAGGGAHEGDHAGEREQQVEQRPVALGGGAEALDGDPHRLARGGRGRLDHAVGLRGRGRRAPPPPAPARGGDERQDGAAGDGGERPRRAVGPQAAPGAPAQRQRRHRSTRSSSDTSRTTRAGTPMTTARAGTSRVTTAPAATNASSPTSRPGVSTAPPPTRQARRRVTPRRAWSRGWRIIVSSLVVTTPGPTKTSSSTVEYAVRYTSVCTRTRSPSTTSLSTVAPRPTTLSAPTTARSRTWAWSPRIARGPTRAPA